MKKIKFIIFLLVTMLFETIAIMISWFTVILEKYKVEGITQDIIRENYSYLFSNPVSAVKTLIENKNPGIIVLSVAALIVAIYITFGTKNKDYKIESKYAVHGSSRFATKSELIRKRQTIGVKEKDFMKDLLSSMEENNEKEKLPE